LLLRTVNELFAAVKGKERDCAVNVANVAKCSNLREALKQCVPAKNAQNGFFVIFVNIPALFIPSPTAPR